MASSRERAFDDLQRIVGELEGIARGAAHAADRRVRRAPWESIAAVAAVAFIAGLFIGRRD